MIFLKVYSNLPQKTSPVYLTFQFHIIYTDPVQKLPQVKTADIWYETMCKTDRKYSRKQNKFWIILIIAVLLVPAFDCRLCIRRYEIITDKTAESVRIALVTDLHSCRYGKEEKELIWAIDSQHPDVVLLGGDICDDKISDDNVEFLLRGIADRYLCYYVTGNHEYWSGRIDDMLELFRSYGVTVLDGSCDTPEINGQQLVICGITDPDAMRYTTDGMDSKSQLDAIAETIDDDHYTILLTHRPELIELYRQYPFDLILSGHAHGGQWRLPGVVNGLFAPDQGFLPEYAGGVYKLPDTTMIVSRGLARESIPVPRIFNRPELVIVTLTPDHR